MPLTPVYNVHVVEVAMATPDIVLVIVRDQSIELGNYVLLDTADPAGLNTIQLRTNTGKAGNPSEYAMVGGIDKKYLKFSSVDPTDFLDRSVAWSAASYSGSSLGGRSVTAVYHQTRPFEQAYCSPAGATHFSRATMEHLIFLQLDGNLAEGGPYSITCSEFTANFTFNDRVTRAHFLHATQWGHRPDDGLKVAYLAGWIPGYGTHGRVNFATTYSIDEAYIINDVGSIVHTCTISERANAGTTEGDHANFRYPSTTQKWRITGCTLANPGVVTYSGTGDPSNGDILWLSGAGGLVGPDGSLQGAWLEVTSVNTTANTFSIGANSQRVNAAGSYVSFNGDTSAYSAFAATYAQGYDNLHQTYLSNRAATHVYEIDYSLFNPAGVPGKYRVYVPGLGVTHKFRIDPAIHLEGAKIHSKGFSAQCYGRAITEAEGWTGGRPVNFKHGTNGVSIKRTKLCAVFDGQNTDSGVSTGFSREVEDAPFATADDVTGFFSPMSDAGDWDFHVLRHIPIAYNLCALWEMLHADCRNLDLGFPLSSDTIGSTYDAIDDLGSIVHMAVWLLEPLRVTQRVSGEVYGGFQVDGDGGGVAGGGNVYEPSWNTQQSGWALAGDHYSAFVVAMAAAKLAWVFQTAGKTTLATTWTTFAESVWDWAEALYQDYAANGATGAVIQAHFNTDLGTQTNVYAGNATNFANAMATLQTKCQAANSSGGARLNAAACLWRATDDYATYGSILNAIGQGILQQAQIATWEYSHKTPDEDATHTANKAYYLGRFDLEADNAHNDGLPGGTTTYPQGGSGTEYYGPSWNPITLMRAFDTTTKNQSSIYLNLLQRARLFNDGANQNGFSCTVGKGSRYHMQALIRDREAMGLRGDAVTGTSPYMWNHNNIPGIALFNFVLGHASTLNFTNIAPRAANPSDLNFTVDPIPHCIPAMMQAWENTYIIYHAEFTTQQTIIPELTNSLHLHGWDGNTATALATQKVRMSILWS